MCPYRASVSPIHAARVRDQIHRLAQSSRTSASISSRHLSKGGGPTGNSFRRTRKPAFLIAI
jgi:hypothetical protein